VANRPPHHVQRRATSAGEVAQLCKLRPGAADLTQNFAASPAHRPAPRTTCNVVGLSSSTPPGCFRYHPTVHPRQSAALGATLLLLAAGLAWFRDREDKPAPPGLAAEAAPSKFHSRGRVAGTETQRMERFRAIWHAVQGGQADPAQAELALELIQSLPAVALKELVTELIATAALTGDPALLGQMARRIGDLEAETGLKWLVAEAALTPENPAFEPLFPAALGGWSESDPSGLLAAYFDDDKAREFRIRTGNATWADDGMGPEIVARAAKDDPDEAWRLIAKWQRRTFGEKFFEGLDPSLVPHFAARIKDLFHDPGQPGFEHLGGSEEFWEMEQAVKKSAAATWFSSQPDQALAWHLEQTPVFPATPDGLEAAQGQQAGALSDRLYFKQPERAMAWLTGKPAPFRAAAAAELGLALVAGPALTDDGLADLRILAAWIGEGPGFDRWLHALPAALAAREQGHRYEEVAGLLVEQLDLGPAEREILERQWRE
jgi:hypothetical protein